ncbi:MAG: sigma-70 family RNA polymerase sigma factor [Phoenicibacter congonensis]|uniref:Sigma-70 family RNA polymerase sigma factor n=1 Tax=Phoenicibacter congonensis TaxID=1944646 RepID=A0AA43RI67_9ACTN|nr:sigma-70 family RNA polymerase sigma factor [Phoenicibacter congonensis]
MTNEELVKQFYDGDQTALHTLYKQNTSFIRATVNDIVKRYRSFIYSRDTLDDLFQIASLEFIERLSSKEYDSDISTVLTYIKPYIEEKVTDYIVAASSVCGISRKSFSLIHECKQLYRDGKFVTDIADELGISKKLVRKCLCHSFRYTAIVYGDDDDNEAGTISESKLGINDLHPDNDVYIRLCCEYMRSLLDVLSAKEQEILFRRYGVYDYEEMSAEEIGDLMLMTRDAVEKSTRASLAKLKKEYYKGSELFYWRNANWGFKDKFAIYVKETKKEKPENSTASTESNT